MKIGKQPAEDPARILAAGQAIGKQVSLFVDANGGYSTKQALAMASRFPEWGVTWYEEPVWHLNLDGLHLLRRTVPPGVEVTAGDYGYDVYCFHRMARAIAVNVLQADAMRCDITLLSLWSWSLGLTRFALQWHLIAAARRCGRGRGIVTSADRVHGQSGHRSLSLLAA